MGMFFRMIAVFVIALLFSGCSEHSTIKSYPTIKGVVIDGEIKGATVFLDLNGNEILDKDEPFTKTDQKGEFSLKLNEAVIKSEAYKEGKLFLIATGGYDIRVKKEFNDILSAVVVDMNKSVVITPVSTLATAWLKSELEKDTKQNRLLGVNKKEYHNFIKVKIEEIYTSLANIFNVRKAILLSNPIELAKKGEISALKIQQQIHKTSRLLKKALKKELQKEKKAIMYAYKAIAKGLKRVKKEAKAKGDKALVEAVKESLNDNRLFAQELKAKIEKDTQVLIKSIDEYFKEKEELLKEKGVDGFLKDLEEKTAPIEENNTLPPHNPPSEGNNSNEENNTIPNPPIENTNSQENNHTLPNPPIDNNHSEENNTLPPHNPPSEGNNTSLPISLIGPKRVSIILGNRYKELGAKVEENVSLEIKGKVNTSKLGKYFLTYIARDNKGNETNVTREVDVISPEILVKNLNVQQKACTHFASLKINNYTYSNNTWGKKQVPEDEDWVQCALAI